MPTYSFTDDDGKIVEQFMPMSEAVPVGDTIYDQEHGRLTRIPDCGNLNAEQIANATWGYPYVSMRHERWKPGAGSYTKDGKPIITSQRNEREFMARHDLKRD